MGIVTHTAVLLGTCPQKIRVRFGGNLYCKAREIQVLKMSGKILQSRQTTERLGVLSRPVRPIRNVHLDDLALRVAKALSGFAYSVTVLKFWKRGIVKFG